MRCNISHRFIKVEREDKIDVITGPTIIKPEINHIVGIDTLLTKAEETMNFRSSYRGRPRYNYRQEGYKTE